MRYIVKSRGVPIGTSALEFPPIGGPSRSGDFHPNAEGQKLLSELAIPHPAMRAYLHRDVFNEDGERLCQPELIGSTMFADLAEALQTRESFQLTLHRSDGSLVPTELIGVQDTKGPCDMSRWDLDEEGEATELANLEPPVIPEGMHCAVTLVITLRGPRVILWERDAITGAISRNEVEYERPEFPRYQLHVVPLDPSTLPWVEGEALAARRRREKSR